MVWFVFYYTLNTPELVAQCGKMQSILSGAETFPLSLTPPEATEGAQYLER